MNKEKYPGVSVRIKAVVVDSIMLLAMMVGASYLFESFERVSDFARAAAFVFIFVLYDPLFTSILGVTIGHFVLGIRVKREMDEQKNILFPFAIIRFAVKALLGWVSLLTVSGNPKGKAIHDLVVKSIVVYKE